MNERKLSVDNDTMSSGLQHSELFTSLTPFIGKIKIEHFSFLRWLVNFYSHRISTCTSNIRYTVAPKILHTAVIFDLHLLLCKKGWL